MLDFGWSEMAIVALVALLVLGPKELPNALKTVALWVRKARKLAREFQSGVDDLVREAELEEARKTVQSVSRVNVNRELEKTIDPTGDVSRAMNVDRDEKNEKKPSPTAPDSSVAAAPDQPAPASDTAPAAEPSAAGTPPHPALESAGTPTSKSA